MKKLMKNIIFLLIFMLFYVIISTKNLIYATNNAVDYKTVLYTISGPITVDPYKYSIWTDAIKFHIDANGYNNKYGDNCTNNFLVYSPDLSAERKAKGYGQYTYKLKALKEFIEYCYSQNQSHTNQSATIPGATVDDSCDYTKLVNLSQSTLSGKSRQFMTTFWNAMLALGNTFNEYQDSYFFIANTLKAIEKIQGTLASEGLEAGRLTARNLSNNKTTYTGQSSKEYLTLLTTYMYSINREEKLASVGKGDLVPFLYFAEHTDITDPYEIGKYAYIALMNEFLKISGTNYWQPEFDYLYFNNLGFTDSELYEEYDLETLEEWYDETYEKYKNDRGAKQNPLIGSDPDTIISSNYTISYQVEAMKSYVQDIYAELGIDMNVNDFIAKNELMAKYMMESSKLDDTIKDYNVSIKFVEENLQRGTYFEDNTSTAVLSDMQVLKFNHTLNIDGQNDGDNISDKTELGNISKIDITGFAEKVYSNKHNGNMSGYEAEIDRIVLNNGYNPDIPNSGHVIKEKDSSGNIKVYYRVYNYDSNPMLIDTDFDGLNDNNDSIKKDNKFQGNTGKIGNIDYNNDFRYFYINNKKYNDELSTMSLMMCNLANGENITTNQVNGDMTEYLRQLGFADRRTKNTFKLNDTETINGRLYMAKKTVQTGASCIDDRRYKDIYGLFLGRFDTIDNYKKLITNFNEEEIKEYYENIVNDAIDFIRTNRETTTNDYCYWVCGYGISGGIASEIANRLVNDGEVYCYTFGATSGNGSSGVNREIKNVLNEDDLIPKLNNHNDGFGRSGIIVNDSIYDNFIVEYKNIIGSDKYEAKHKRANSLKQMIINAKDNDDEDYDQDKLTNIEEKNYGTDYDNADTDFDSISDYDEIKGVKTKNGLYTYQTDPLNDDTDNDGLRDNSELKLNLDPTNPNDANTRVAQVISTTSVLPKELTIESPTPISFRGELVGDIDENVRVKKSSNQYYDTLESTIGDTIIIDTTYGYNDGLKITFDLSKYSNIKDRIIVCKLADGKLTVVEGTYFSGDTLISDCSSGEYVLIDSMKVLQDMNIFMN